MANIDVACGIKLASLNALISQYYTSASSVSPLPYPIAGQVVKSIDNVGQVTLDWQIDGAPSLVFGPPSQDVWDASLDANGSTNGQDGNPVPSGPVVQLLMPALSASFVIGSNPPVGGQTQNLATYATLAFPAGEIDIDLLGLTIDESDFSAWDKAIFNEVLVPQIFKIAGEMIGVVHLPQISWEGVTLNPIHLSIAGDQLFAAATLTTNSAPLDITGVTFPTDPVFVVASSNLFDTALAAGLKPYQGKAFADSGDFKGLADWDYSGTLNSVTATLSAASPLTIDASVTLSLNAGGKLTPAGMALAAVGCALGAGLLAA